MMCRVVQGLLYKNAMDSFGQLTEGMMYHFPHFQPIAGEHFKYRADRDELVAEDAEQSDFIRTRERMFDLLAEAGDASGRHDIFLSGTPKP